MSTKKEVVVYPKKQQKIRRTTLKKQQISRKGKKSGSSGITNKSTKVDFIVEGSEPIVYTKSIKMKSPKFSRSSDGSLTLKNQELATGVLSVAAGSGATYNGFQLIQVPVNAGLSSCFPWLSGLAAQYVTYKFDMLEMIFIPRNATTQPGSIMMYAEYDPSSSRPENRKDFLNRKNAQECQIFKSMIFKLDVKDMQKEKSHYVRVGKVQSGSDIKLLDTCTFYIAYEGTTPNTVLGDLFWKYSVVLTTPDLKVSRNLITKIETCAGTTATSGSATNALPFGVLTAANFVGDFIGAGLSAATGGLSVQAFATAKTILKYIQGYFPTNAGTPAVVNCQVLEQKLLIKDDDELQFYNEDDFDLLSIAAAATSQTVLLQSFTDLSSTNVTVVDNIVVGGSNDRYMTWAVSCPANCVIAFSQASGIAPGGVPNLVMTDLDPNKIGLNLSQVDINYN
jgi:hypothetical protein